MLHNVPDVAAHLGWTSCCHHKGMFLMSQTSVAGGFRYTAVWQQNASFSVLLQAFSCSLAVSMMLRLGDDCVGVMWHFAYGQSRRMPSVDDKG